MSALQNHLTIPDFSTKETIEFALAQDFLKQRTQTETQRVLCFYIAIIAMANNSNEVDVDIAVCQ